MAIRVPLLLQKSVAVVHRLDIAGTRAVDPPGEDASGYDDIFREPIAYDTGGERVDTRTELPAVYVPCQVELASDQRLQELGVGDAGVSRVLFVFHRMDLERLGLLDSNGDVVFKNGDRISHLERYGAAVGTVVKTFEPEGLFVHEMRSASWGFGPDGYDLELAIVRDRREGPTT